MYRSVCPLPRPGLALLQLHYEKTLLILLIARMSMRPCQWILLRLLTVFFEDVVFLAQLGLSPVGHEEIFQMLFHGERRRVLHRLIGRD